MVCKFKENIICNFSFLSGTLFSDVDRGMPMTSVIFRCEWILNKKVTQTCDLKCKSRGEIAKFPSRYPPFITQQNIKLMSHPTWATSQV